MEYQPRLDLVEAQRIADALSLTLDDFLKKYADKRWPGTQSFLLRKRRGACIFLKRMPDRKQAICLIHSFRRSTCRDWMPGLHQRECLEGLTRYWGLAANTPGKLVGSARSIQRFQHFQELLVSEESLHKSP